MNVRALGSPESARSLRGGLEALELCSVAVRSLFRSIDDWVRNGMIEPDAAYAARARTAWADCSPTSPSWSARSGHCCGPRSRAGRRPRRRPCPTRWTGSGSTASRHAEYLLANPREHPDLWELDGALVALVDRMLLELDTAAHAKLWEDHRRDVLDRHRATELFERLRSRRGDERAAGTETPAPEGAPPEERPSRGKKAPRGQKPPPEDPAP